jgi:hypothetical protein
MAPVYKHAPIQSLRDLLWDGHTPAQSVAARLAKRPTVIHHEGVEVFRIGAQAPVTE